MGQAEPWPGPYSRADPAEPRRDRDSLDLPSPEGPNNPPLQRVLDRLRLAQRLTEAATEGVTSVQFIPGMIVQVRRGAFARQMGQVVRQVHVGCVLIKMTLTGAVLPFGPSELR